MKALLAVFLLLSLPGCAGMLDSLRQESAAIDKEDPAKDGDRAADYVPPGPAEERRMRGVSANNVPSYSGDAHRGFGRRLASLDHDGGAGDEDAPAGTFRSDATPPPAANYRRVTRQDFVDNNASENSLWDGQGQTNYLFSTNRMRQPGDMVTADVEKELKREIQYQLWMTIPPEQRRPPRRTPASAEAKKPVDTSAPPATAAAADPKAAGGKPALEKNKDAAAEAAKTNMAADDDTVKMEVAENMGNGLVRVVGQKRVIYRGQARIVEVTGLANSKDIDDSNRVKSSAFLDMKTQVIQ